MTVSVIIPSYNTARFIGRCLRSLAADRDVIDEIIVVDDASTDDSVAAVAALELPAVRLIRNPTNLGAARSRSIGAAAATADYITLLDADDFLSDGAVTLAHQALVRHSADLSIFQMKRVSEDERSTEPFLDVALTPFTGAQAFARSVGGWRIHPMGVMRKALYRDVADNFEFHGFSDDELMTRRLFLAADRLVGNAGVYHYRYVEKPISFAKVLGQSRTNLEVLKMALVHRDLLSTDQVTASRAIVARNLLSLARRARGSAEAASALDLVANFRALAVSAEFGGWRQDMMTVAASTWLRARQAVQRQ